jgi:hypothetical protein
MCLRHSDEDALEDTCEANLALKWMTEVSSSVYATPLIHDLFSDGHKDVIVSTFVHYLEARGNPSSRWRPRLLLPTPRVPACLTPRLLRHGAPASALLL